jgi:hypothetical protein
MENISKHISYKEATRSITAIRNNIINNPNEKELENMKALAENVFEPLREALGGKPIHIASFYRGKYLNDLIGGAVGSQHMAQRGAAIDLDNDSLENPTNREIFDYIKDNLDFDQLIYERNFDGNPGWVHVSFNKDRNKNQVLFFDGVKYYPYNKTLVE